MPLHKFTFTFEPVTGLAEDAIVNTWYFDGTGSDPDNVEDMLVDFYGVTPTGGSVPVSGYMSDDIITGDVTITAYDMSDPIPRTPVYTGNRTLATLSSTESMPTEVALCLSYHAAPSSGIPPARLRGRVYLGPFTESASTAARPGTSFLNDVRRAARDLLQASNAATSWEWVMYSPTRSAHSMVVGGWVDNQWDTQRRRGQDATSRNPWDAGTP